MLGTARPSRLRHARPRHGACGCPGNRQPPVIVDRPRNKLTHVM